MFVSSSGCGSPAGVVAVGWCDLTATGPELEVDPEAGRDDLVPSVDMVVPSLVVAECD